MLLQSNWHRNRKNQLIIAIVGLQLYLILGVVLPSYESQPYYRDKITLLQRTHDSLKQQALHIDYYQNRKGATETSILELKKGLVKAKNASHLQKQINKLLKSHRLTVITQHIATIQSNPDFEIMKLEQSLSGTFSNLIGYLEKVEEINPHLLLTQTHFINQSPLKEDPTILLNLQIQTFCPKEL